MRIKWTKRRIFSAVWVIAGLLFLAWLGYSYQAHGVSKTLLESTPEVKVADGDDYISFEPTKPFDTVVIFYPGAMVDPKAYVPLCRKLAESGRKTILVKMPWRQASRGYTKPLELNLLSDPSKRYILAGHSQGAKMAAQFVHENPGRISKLILIGTTHPRDIDMSQSKTATLKILGANDGVASPKKSTLNDTKLPANAQIAIIPGANHSQFGYYGFQLGDNRASITREEQQRLTLEKMLTFIEQP